MPQCIAENHLSGKNAGRLLVPVRVICVLYRYEDKACTLKAQSWMGSGSVR